MKKALLGVGVPAISDANSEASGFLRSSIFFLAEPEKDFADRRLSHPVTLTENRPCAYGSFADVYRGVWDDQLQARSMDPYMLTVSSLTYRLL